MRAFGPSGRFPSNLSMFEGEAGTAQTVCRKQKAGLRPRPSLGKAGRANEGSRDEFKATRRTHEFEATRSQGIPEAERRRAGRFGRGRDALRAWPRPGGSPAVWYDIRWHNKTRVRARGKELSEFLRRALAFRDCHARDESRSVSLHDSGIDSP